MVGKVYVPEEVVYLTGIIKWCKHVRPDSTYNKWSVVMYIVGEELEKARMWQAKQGIKNNLKMDDDGWYITLSRKTTITVKGRDVGLEPPKVIDKDGIPITEMVGNGSAGTAKCVLWSTKNYPGKNLRWEALKIDNLVKFNPEKDFLDGGESVKELREQPQENLF